MTLVGEPVYEGAVRGNVTHDLQTLFQAQPSQSLSIHQSSKEFLKYRQLALRFTLLFYISSQIDISYIKSDRDVLAW